MFKFCHLHILKNFYQYEVDNLAGNSFSLESLLLSKFLRNVDSNYVMLWMECQFFDSDYMHASHKSKLHMTLTFKLIFKFLFFKVFFLKIFFIDKYSFKWLIFSNTDVQLVIRKESGIPMFTCKYFVFRRFCHMTDHVINYGGP